MFNSITNESVDNIQNSTESNVYKTPITEQFNKLQQLLTVNDTAKTFGTSLQLLFSLIKESMILIWLALCWGIVALSWLGNNTQQLGGKLKGYWNLAKEFSQHPKKQDIANKTIQFSFDKSKSALQQVVSEAKKQVGFQEDHTKNT
jgi:hypothetical protein